MGPRTVVALLALLALAHAYLEEPKKNWSEPGPPPQRGRVMPRYKNVYTEQFFKDATEVCQAGARSRPAPPRPVRRGPHRHAGHAPVHRALPLGAVTLHGGAVGAGPVPVGRRAASAGGLVMRRGAPAAQAAHGQPRRGVCSGTPHHTTPRRAVWFASQSCRRLAQNTCTGYEEGTTHHFVEVWIGACACPCGSQMLSAWFSSSLCLFARDGDAAAPARR
jgi:hypothetical protein